MLIYKQANRFTSSSMVDGQTKRNVHQCFWGNVAQHSSSHLVLSVYRECWGIFNDDNNDHKVDDGYSFFDEKTGQFIERSYSFLFGFSF